MHIQPCRDSDLDEWISLRRCLWPHPEAEHRAEVLHLLENPGALVLLARQDGEAIGFAEATLRHDYVNGCTTSPVAFLEGIFVAEAWRRRGVARSLCHQIENWALSRGCSEFASDAWLDATLSHRMHAALGFSETERVVYFRKALKP